MKRISRTLSATVLSMLLIVSLLIILPLAVKAEDGVQLPTNNQGDFGLITGPIQELIEDILAPSGLNEAAAAANDAITALAGGHVPVISELGDPFNGNVEDAIQSALDDAQTVLQIMNNVAGPQIQTAFTCHS